MHWNFRAVRPSTSTEGAVKVGDHRSANSLLLSLSPGLAGRRQDAHIPWQSRSPAQQRLFTTRKAISTRLPVACWAIPGW